jgi:Uma2 family endonuclease
MATQITTETTNPRIPSLQQGDHLTRDEFERRYEAMPDLKKAELIEGIVYLSSPVRLDQHGEPQMAMVGWLTYYRAHTPGVRGGDNATVRLDLENEPQPDGLLFREPGLGGRAVVGPEGYLEGAPELVVEIAASTVSYDLNTKLRVYRRNQVQEYIVWRVEDSAIDWFTLQRGEYVRLPLSKAGFYQSNVFPGLWLDPVAMIRDDLPTVFKVLGDGIASPEHLAFVAKNKPT